jgi:nucleoside-diphosphate-sugar epimerase
MELRDAVVLVTGANGFVGEHVVRRLVRDGAKARALVRRREAGAALAGPGVDVVVGDPGDAGALRRAVPGARAVVHCAASSSDDRAEALRVNATGTEMLLEAARAAGCERFVHISTIAVYDFNGRQVMDEDAPLVSTSGWAYAESKAEAERAVRRAMEKGLAATILRPGTILGVHPTSTWGNAMPRAIAAGQFPVAGDGGGAFGYVHVEDLAELVVKALRSEAAVGQAFNAVDGHTTFGRYARHFNPSPASAPEHVVPALMSFRGTYPNDKAVRLLGHAPRHTFEQVMEETVRYLREG